jgi:hypothetical protein
VEKDQLASTTTMHIATSNMDATEGKTDAGMKGKRNKENFNGMDWELMDIIELHIIGPKLDIKFKLKPTESNIYIYTF